MHLDHSWPVGVELDSEVDAAEPASGAITAPAALFWTIPMMLAMTMVTRKTRTRVRATTIVRIWMIVLTRTKIPI